MYNTTQKTGAIGENLFDNQRSIQEEVAVNQPSETAKQVIQQWKGWELTQIENRTAKYKGADFIYTLKAEDGSLITKRIEVKTDTYAWTTGNVVAEIVLDVASGKPGWFWTSDTDLQIYTIVDSDGHPIKVLAADMDAYRELVTGMLQHGMKLKQSFDRDTNCTALVYHVKIDKIADLTDKSSALFSIDKSGQVRRIDKEEDT